MGFTQSKAPELSRHCQTLLRRLAFVDGQQRRTRTTAQELRDGFIRSRDALLAIDDHHRNTGFLHGQSRLLADLRQKFAVVIEHQAAGVDHLELTVAPVTILIGAVTGDAGLVMHNRLATAAQPVHQGRLADIGASDDRNDRTRQGGGAPINP